MKLKLFSRLVVLIPLRFRRASLPSAVPPMLSLPQPVSVFPCPAAGVSPPLPSAYAHGGLLQHATHPVLPSKPPGQRRQGGDSQAWRFGRVEGEDASVSL